MIDVTNTWHFVTHGYTCKFRDEIQQLPRQSQDTATARTDDEDEILQWQLQRQSRDTATARTDDEDEILQWQLPRHSKDTATARTDDEDEIFRCLPP